MVRMKHHITIGKNKRVESPLGFRKKMRNYRREKESKKKKGEKLTRIIRVLESLCDLGLLIK